MPPTTPRPAGTATPILTLAPTGPIATTRDNPHLPVTPEAIAAAATTGYEAGAAVVHVHLRDAHERPTADLDIARHTVELIEAGSPILIQLSTGVGPGVSFEDRARLVELQPAMATLNPCSMTFGEGEFSNPPQQVAALAARMQELGVKPELEIYDTGHLEVCLDLAERGLLDPPLQFSFVLGVRGGMAATPRNLLTMVDRLPDGAIWQVVAIGAAHLQLTALALALGGNARTGLEDTLRLRRGVDATNAALLERLVRLARDLELTPAGIEQATGTLQLRAGAEVATS